MNALATSSSSAGCALSRALPPALRPAPILGWSISAMTQRGVALEVMAIELEDGSLLVIHAMPLRDRYREQYDEARKWRR